MQITLGSAGLLVEQSRKTGNVGTQAGGGEEEVGGGGGEGLQLNLLFVVRHTPAAVRPDLPDLQQYLWVTTLH